MYYLWYTVEWDRFSSFSRALFFSILFSLHLAVFSVCCGALRLLSSSFFSHFFIFSLYSLLSRFLDLSLVEYGFFDSFVLLC